MCNNCIALKKDISKGGGEFVVAVVVVVVVVVGAGGFTLVCRLIAETNEFHSSLI